MTDTPQNPVGAGLLAKAECQSVMHGLTRKPAPTLDLCGFEGWRYNVN